MAVKDRNTLKSYFETFDKPTEGEFGDLIDSLILNGDSYNMDVVVPWVGDKALTSAGGGTTDNFDTTLTLSRAPVVNTGIIVEVNGVAVEVGNGSITKACYFSRDGGTTAVAFSDLQLGDTLYWNGLIAGYDLTTHRIDFSYVILNPTVVNFGTLEPVLKTGTLVDYSKSAIYGSPASPETADITDTMTSSYRGFEQKIYHNNGIAPAVPGHWVKMTANNYVTSQLNTIKAVLTVGGRVEYEILQDN